MLKDRTVTANANTVILIHFYSHYFKPNNLSLLYGARLHYNEIMHIYSTYSSFKKRNTRIYFTYYICNDKNMQQTTLHCAAMPTSPSHMLCSTHIFQSATLNRFSFLFLIEWTTTILIGQAGQRIFFFFANVANPPSDSIKCNLAITQ